MCIRDSLGNVMSMNEAKDKGCEEVIMHKNNFITEGGASNIFFVKDNLVMTPALTNNILPGITRELLIKAIKNEGIDVQEGKYTLEDLIDSESIDNAIQKTIAIGGIDPLNFDIKVEEASMSQAQGWLEEKFPNGDFKHLVIDEENGVYELIYNPMGNIY